MRKTICSILFLTLLAIFPVSLWAQTGTIYFVNTSNWDAPYAYCWSPNIVAWPGQAMTTSIQTSQNHDVYAYDYQGRTNIIFSDNGNNQTADLTILDNQAYHLAKGKWFAPTGLYLVGTVTDEDLKDANKFSTWDGSSPTVVTKSVSLAANTTYTFRVLYYDGVTRYYRTNNAYGTMTSTNHGWWNMDGDGVGGSLYTNITTTRGGTYTFKYDWAENVISVDWPESECIGSGLRHFDGFGEPIEYKVEYADGKINFSVWAIDPAKTVDFLEVQWWNSATGRQNVVGTAANGVGTYSLNLASFPALTAGAEIYFRFHYGVRENGARYLTSNEPIDNTNPQTCYVRVGDCTGETNPPCMTSASIATNGANSVTLNVAATDDSGIPDKFIVTENNSLIAEQTLTATAGQITISGLASCTDYTFHIVAKDKMGNVSSDNTDPNCQYKELNVTTAAQTDNMAVGKTITGLITDNAAEHPGAANDGNYGTRHTTYTCHAPNAWLLVDLGSTQLVKNVRLYWEVACSDDYEIQFSMDGNRFYTVYHQTTEPVNGGSPVPPAGKQDHILTNVLPTRYIKLVSNHYTGGRDYWSIWELEVYGEGDCYEPDNTLPTMVSATPTASTESSITLTVSATDDETDPVWLYEIDGNIYCANEGQIIIDGLTNCTNYSWEVYAIDNSGNRSTNYVTTVSAQTTSISSTTNRALLKSVTAGYEALPATYAVDGAGVINANDQTRWGTQGRPSIDNDWIQVDLGEPIYIDHIKIQWEQARPQQYQILLSLNGIDWQTWQYNVAPHWEDAGNHAYETYNMSGAAARYIKVQSQVNATDWGISIWEFEVYGTGECYIADDVPPVMVSAAVSSSTASTATISVSATDNITDPVTNFKIGDEIYVATAGAITMENLSPCQTYTWRIYAMDGDGNLSLNYIDVTHQVEMPAAGTNLALLHPVYSGFDQGGCPKGAAVDGDRTTRWATTGRPTSDDEWLVVDLQGIYKIDSIQVEWEYGTSINYEFKTAYEAEFGKNGSWDVLTSGHFATFDHRNEQPEGAKRENMELNEKTHQTADHVIDHYYYTDQQVYGRFIELKSGLMADYASSLWEIRVYGQCAEISHKPVMQWAEIIYANDHEAELYVSALDYETPEERMGYKVVVTGGEAGYTQISTEYIFTYSQFANGSAGHLILGGLIPDVPYEVKIYAIDEDGNTSDNYKTLTFTTLSPDGCVFSGTEAYNVSGIGNHSSQIFQKGYRVTINGDEDSFTIIAYTDDDFYELDPPIIQILVSDPSNPVGSSVEQRTMVAVAGQERTYEYTFNRGDNVYPAIRDWTGKVKFFVKYPFRNGGICLTYPIEYDVVEGCPAVFVIFHQDDQPTATSRTTYAGGTIENSISYYRHFIAGIWEDLTMPFDVDSIMVYDTEDHRYYKLTAQYNNGSTVKGKFLLRKQVDLVSGEDFQNSWYDGDSPLPQKGQPYAIRFTSSYYANKYVLFKGHKGQTIATDFSKGTVPTADDQYQVYGNLTMSYQSVGTAYLLDADHQEEIYRRVADAQVRPFETYVLASANTTSRMAHIAPWRPMPEITTGLDETEEMMTVRARVDVFTVTGQHIGTWTDATLQDVSDECANRLQPGCYVVHSTGFTAKMIVK